MPQIFGMNLVLGLMLVGIHFTFDSSWVRLAGATFVCVVYFLATWLLLVDKRDKPRIGEALRLLTGQSAA